MTEPGSGVVIIGSGISYAATLLLGPVLGEYAIIVGMGLLGTIVALADFDTSQEDELRFSFTKLWMALKFVFRGVALSVAFSGVLAFAVSKMLPADYGVTPYAIISAVSFAIGWTSNKWSQVKDSFVGFLSSIINRQQP